MGRILIADDARIMRNILRLILEKQGHEVVGEAESGEEALELFDQLRPDLVTLDIHMEPGDGITCLEKIRERDKEARVLMVSAIGQKRKINEAMRLGALGYVTKPFQQDDIFQQVKSALES